MDRLCKLLNDDSALTSAWTGISDYLYLSYLSQSSFGSITLDMQHGMQTEAGVLPSIAMIAPSGKPVIVRIPVGRFEFASKALDAGAHCIIAPMINTVEDAREFVSFTKFVPTGDRSFGPSQVLNVLGIPRDDYLQNANVQTLSLAMIETREALSNLDDILSVDGIDGVFCGPADLSISLRNIPSPEPFGEDSLDAVKQISSAAKSHNKLAATFCVTPQAANLAHSLGYRFIALGFDSSYLHQGTETLLAQLDFKN